ncbi:MAG: biotin/lipoyl-containing protein [candidate division WOR-3 bacterium]
MKLFIEVEGELIEIEKMKNFEIIEMGKNFYLVFIDNKPYFFSLKDLESGKIFDDGKNKFFIRILHSSFEVKEKVHKTYEILSPIPGLIVDVLVSENQPVKKGETLFIVEAMKMRNQIKSPIDGIVKSIKVQKGKTVNMKELLAVIESQT